jgi:hypothetical protein
MTADPAPSRRRFQFSLRTLLIGVTVVTIVAVVIASVASRIAYEQRIKDMVVGKWVCKINGHPFKAVFERNGNVLMGPDGVPGPDAYGGDYTFNPEDRTIKLHLLVDRGGPGDLERVDEDAHLTQDNVLVLDAQRLRLTRPP